MTQDPRDDPQGTAVDRLTEFGLGVYAARTLVALVGLGDGTAREVSETVDVPRPRVYDAASELQEHGLVDVRHSSPRRFWPVSAKTAARTLRRDSEQRIEELTVALEALESDDRPQESVGVWTVTGRGAVTDRCLEFIERADERVVFATVGDLLTEDVLDGLADASDRGADVRVAGLADDVGDRIAERIPEARTFESLWVFSDTPAGRLLLVDGETTLVSVRTDDVSREDGAPGETAVWGSGEHNHLSVVLRALFAWRLDDPDG